MIIQCRVKSGERRRPSAPTKRAGRCQRSSTASPPVTMLSRSSRVTAERSSCRPTSTRAGRRPPTSSARPRRPASARRIRTGSHGLSRPNLTALQGRWRASVSKSDTKEPRRCQPVKQNVGIMRFLLAGSVPFWAFVSVLDTAGRSAPEEGRAAPLRRSAPPPRRALRGGTRRRPTPQSVLRAG